MANGIANGHEPRVDSALKLINVVGLSIILAVLGWVANTTLETHSDVIRLHEQVKAFEREMAHMRERADDKLKGVGAEIDYLDNRVDQHDDRLTNMGSRIRGLENSK